MSKPARSRAQEDDLPSVESHDEDEGSWSSGIVSEEDEQAPSDIDESDVSSASSSALPKRRKTKHADEEMPYETLPRKRRPSWEPESEQGKGIERLPTKTADGQIQRSGERTFLRHEAKEVETSEDESEGDAEEPAPREDITTGARFGRLAVVDVISRTSRKARIQGAQEQIASICQEILSDPENSVSCYFRFLDLSLTFVANSLVCSDVFTHFHCPRFLRLPTQNRSRMTW